MKQMRLTLSNPPLRRLLLAQAPADFADWMDAVAIIALLAYHWHVAPLIFAFLAVAFALPYLIVGPAAGALVDRMDVRRILILSNLGRGLATLALAFAPGWPTLLALIALRGAVDCFFGPAKQAALQALAPSDQRMAANGLSHAINQASKIVAPSLGGLALIVWSPGGVFLANAAMSFAAAALVLGLPRLPPAPRSGQSEGGLFAHIRDGLAEVRGNPLVLGTLGLMAAGYFAMFFYDTLIAPLIRDLGLSQSGLGLAIAAVGAGGVAGALWAGTGKSPRRPFLWIAGGSVLSGLLIGGLGFAELLDRRLSLPLVCALFAVIGFATSLLIVPTRVILQNEVAPERIGRITALGEAANSLAILIAPFPGAALASAFSTGAAFVAGAALMLLAAFWALALNRAHHRP
ncbi:MAG TPA: MFS transporter [Paracoccaceae bacterium]|nr:MFS transporter [Paracoccaceae bacterium]